MSISKKINLLVFSIIGIFALLQAFIIQNTLESNKDMALQRDFSTLEASVNNVLVKAKAILLNEIGGNVESMSRQVGQLDGMIGFSRDNASTLRNDVNERID
jgi:hypothetical protein